MAVRLTNTTRGEKCVNIMKHYYEVPESNIFTLLLVMLFSCRRLHGSNVGR